MTLEQIKGLTYEERNALPIIRKMLRRKPELITLLMEDVTKESAAHLLIKARDELSALLVMNRAFINAAAELVKIDKKEAQTATCPHCARELEDAEELRTGLCTSDDCPRHDKGG